MTKFKTAHISKSKVSKYLTKIVNWIFPLTITKLHCEDGRAGNSVDHLCIVLENYKPTEGYRFGAMKGGSIFFYSIMGKIIFPVKSRWLLKKKLCEKDEYWRSNDVLCMSVLTLQLSKTLLITVGWGNNKNENILVSTFMNRERD